MNKRYLHHLWVTIREVKVWYLAIPFLICLAVAVIALRQNNLHMITLRQRVYDADKQGQHVEEALSNLREYVHGHMNTSLDTQTGVYPPIQLKYTFERYQAAEQNRVKLANDGVYSQAQQTCEAAIPAGFSGRGRVGCIENYVATHTVVAKTIPDALYKFDFVTPALSFDVAGIATILATIFALLLIVRLGLGFILKSLSK